MVFQYIKRSVILVFRFSACKLYGIIVGEKNLFIFLCPIKKLKSYLCNLSANDGR